MHLLPSLTFAQAAALLFHVTVITAFNGSDIIFERRSPFIMPGPNTPSCPFDVSSTVSSDLILRIGLSTLSSAANDSLVSLDGAYSQSVLVECIIGVSFHTPGTVTEFQFTTWNVEGVVALDKGLVAKVGLKPYWYSDYEDIQMPYTNTTIAGPTSSNQAFSRPLNGTKIPEKGGYCSGLIPGVRTYQAQGIWLNLALTIEKGPDAESAAQGTIGRKSGKALSLSTQLVTKDGCSRKNLTCDKDRTNFELCYWNDYPTR